jgi:cleavage and polyadenylation specificity factor subunit 4
MVVAYVPNLAFDFDADVYAALPQLGDANGSRIDPRHRTVVCRHWLKGLCQKGDFCEYLHQMDLDKMPICKWGAQCQARPNCMYRHIDEEERPDCIFYRLVRRRVFHACLARPGSLATQLISPVPCILLLLITRFRQGFCKHGPTCRFKHVKLGQEDIPEEADFTLWQSTGAGADIAGDASGERPEAERPMNFKTSLCKHWAETGNCPFSTKCHFAHGQDELRKYRREDKERQAAAAGVMDPTSAEFSGGDGAALPVPAELMIPFPPEAAARYFVAKSVSYQNLAISASHGKWAVQRKHTPVLNEAFATADHVVFLFSVVGSNQFQGCALMTGDIDEVEGGASRGDWTPEFSVEWLRLCEVPFASLSTLSNPLDDDIAVTSSRDGQEIEKNVGRAVLTLMFTAEEVMLPPAADLGTELKLGTAADIDAELGPQFPVPEGKPGFMFITGGPNLNECLGKLIFGMPKHQAEAASQSIEPGQFCFLLDMTRRLLFGIFEIVSPVENLIDPSFCRDGGRETPFPAQVRVRVVLEVPPVDCSLPDLQLILPEDTRKRQTRLNRDQVQRLATLVAGLGGALSFAPPLPPPPTSSTGVKRDHGSGGANEGSPPPKNVKRERRR